MNCADAPVCAHSPPPLSTSTFNFGILPRMKRNVVLVAVLLGAAGGGAGTLRDGAL